MVTVQVLTRAGVRRSRPVCLPHLGQPAPRRYPGPNDWLGVCDLHSTARASRILPGSWGVIYKGGESWLPCSRVAPAPRPSMGLPLTGPPAPACVTGAWTRAAMQTTVGRSPRWSAGRSHQRPDVEACGVGRPGQSGHRHASYPSASAPPTWQAKASSPARAPSAGTWRASH